jgi:hypothetical protein
VQEAARFSFENCTCDPVYLAPKTSSDKTMSNVIPSQTERLLLEDCMTRDPAQARQSMLASPSSISFTLGQRKPISSSKNPGLSSAVMESCGIENLEDDYDEQNDPESQTSAAHPEYPDGKVDVARYKFLVGLVIRKKSQVKSSRKIRLRIHQQDT